MPTTVGGLLILAVFLVPGFVFHVTRRARVPVPRLSPLVETATFITVSATTNLVALAVFAVVRAVMPTHTPEPSRILTDGTDYLAAQSGYVFLWAAAVLALSGLLAWLAAIRWGPVGFVSKRLAPVIADVTAWYYAFESCPDNKHVYVGCDLIDGSYLGGFLDWYSTEVDESPDRDLVLAEPIRYRGADDDDDQPLRYSRVIIAAREVRRLYVTYVDLIPAMSATTEG